MNKQTKLTCCFIPEDQQGLLSEDRSQPLPDGVGCEKDAVWQVWWGNSLDDNTLACNTHIGELLNPDTENRVYLIEK